jgi:hypothetical protein
MSDDFVRDLEDELVAAARYRAAHPPRRIALPARPGRRVVLHALAAGAVAALAIAAVFAIARGGDAERTAGTPPVQQGAACGQVAPELRDRVTALSEPQRLGSTPPRAAIDAVEEWDALGAIVLDGARYWGSDDGVDFWVVPVARGAGDCVPAADACVVAVTGGDADAICGPGPEPGAVQWRIVLLPGGRSAAFGMVPDRATAVTVEAGGRSAEVEAGLNVFGGVLPFPVRDGDGPVVDVTYARITGAPRVGVVDGGGDAVDAAERLMRAGFAAAGPVTPGDGAQRDTSVYWRTGRVSREDAARVAAVVGASQRVQIDDADDAPRPVREAGAPVVVVVGSGS